jgi:hypothetical protein
MGLGDVDYATQFRGVIRDLVTEELNRQRPMWRYGVVTWINRFNMTANVILQGDTEEMPVKMAQSVQPAVARLMDDGVDATGDVIVRVEGVPGDLWITEVVAGRSFLLAPRIINQRLMGGDFLNTIYALHDTVGTTINPSVGNATMLGRWNQIAPYGGTTTGMLHLVVTQTFFSGNAKYYIIPMKFSWTGTNWRKVFPVMEDGDYVGHDFDLEVQMDGNGFGLRVRTTRFNTGTWTPAGYNLDMWAHTFAAYRVSGPDGVEITDAPPTVMLGDYADDSGGKGSLMAPAQGIPRIAQAALTGGGICYWDGTIFTWTERFVMDGIGKSSLSPDGYWEIGVPAGSVSIPVLNDSTRTTATTGVGNVPLNYGDSLYYDPPVGAGHAFVESRLRIVSHTGTTNLSTSVPPHWILICSVNSDTASSDVKIGTGETIDAWKNLSLNSPYATYGTPYGSPAVRKLGNGLVVFKGLVQSSGAGGLNLLSTVLPVGFRPTSRRLFATQASTGAARIDVDSAGQLILSVGLTNTQWISLDPIQFSVAV